jgi:hypothetical protein
MRSFPAVLVIACRAPAPARPPVAPVPTTPQPACPSDLAAKLVGQYTGETAATDIQIGACEWGRFAGPGWIVFHHVPHPPGRAVDVGPRGGRVFVDQAGQIVAAEFSEGMEHPVVQAVDLDGDGADEIVATHRWFGMASAGEQLSVWRVAGKKVESLGTVSLSYEMENGDAGVKCSGTLEVVDAPTRGRQLVIVSTLEIRGGMGPDPNKPCPPRRIVRLVDGALVEDDR